MPAGMQSACGPQHPAVQAASQKGVIESKTRGSESGSNSERDDVYVPWYLW